MYNLFQPGSGLKRFGGRFPSLPLLLVCSLHCCCSGAAAVVSIRCAWGSCLIRLKRFSSCNFSDLSSAIADGCAWHLARVRCGPQYNNYLSELITSLDRLLMRKLSLVCKVINSVRFIQLPVQCIQSSAIWAYTNTCLSRSWYLGSSSNFGLPNVTSESFFSRPPAWT